MDIQGDLRCRPSNSGCACWCLLATFPRVRPCANRGIRQRLFKLWKDQNWRDEYQVLIGDGGDIFGDYSEQLASSKFCLVVPGEGQERTTS